ncbi:ferric reductase like transmembrane component-domain-containing protein [Cercophora newfieldiana]|uniref:Ferric reductase like transmembrane component-domain-containing protein n=1 Tax=Cercophora newfieldiana TaxID=92897 RepID=A0AA39YDD7_9PEZI|nr:ferric reductase like transmembrane component-domain-containing protein [Cercophora newfieldiana]
MGWPYHFVDLNSAEKALRREALDKYAFYAQLSAVLPLGVVLLYRVAAWAAKPRQDSYSTIPNSPVLKSQRLASSGLSSRIRRVKWWLGEDFSSTNSILGQRDEWVIGFIWMAWLLLLSVVGTGQDYLHFTKRLGLVAASQFPIQYLLSLKSLNPYAYVFRSSHEHINRYHRVLGRVIYALLASHVGLYLNFFVQAGVFSRRMQHPVVVAGVIAFTLLNLLFSTALRPLRALSYRLFFITHLVVAVAAPVILCKHAPPARIFMGESLLIFIADLVSRKLDTVASQATLESIPGTSLVKITASIPHSKVNRFRLHPGAHVYLNIPAAARKSIDPKSAAHLLFEFLFNPFTVASVDNTDVTLITRQRSGPMTKALASFAGTEPLTSNPETTKIPLSLEGPYGVSTRFPQLASGDFDRILLVAGGIGATFTVPIYRAITGENPSARVQMVWAARAAGDATWAVTNNGKSLLEDDNVQIFLTGGVLNGTGGDGNGSGAESREGMEMGSMQRDRRRGRVVEHNRRRPDLKKVVDGVFGHGAEERVAVLVCGPEGMAKELRGAVGPWVRRGRVVWWHKEGFGF